MKAKRTQILTSFVQITLCFLILAVTGSCAKDLSTKEISVKDQQLIDFQRLRSAQTAKFVLIPWLQIPIEIGSKVTRWDDSAFKEIGCTYSTQDPALIAKLIDAFKLVNIEKSLLTPFRVSDEAFAFDVRQGIYLTLSDGAEVKFLFGQVIDPVSKRVTGEYIESPKLRTLAISANSSLSHLLAEWAVKTGKPIAKEKWVERDCERHVSYYSLHDY